MWRRRSRRASDHFEANKKKPPGFTGRFYFWFDPYSPLPKRRDHQPALRGASSPDVAGAGSVGADAGDSTGSGALWLTEGAGSAGALVTKLTFSRTVERRRAAARSASWLVSSADGAGARSSTTGPGWA